MQLDASQNIHNTTINYPRLYGLDGQSLIAVGEFLLEQYTATAFSQIQQAAELDGFNLQICSAYRPFEKQMAIWNAKADGKRPLLDKASNPIEFNQLNEQQLIDTILLWSALPGASRHHWGTDMDVFDANKIDKKSLQLITAEYIDKGPCADLHLWLKQHAQTFGFYFPYQPQLSGVSPEPWHLSYFPLADQYLAQFSITELAKILSNAEISLKSSLLERLTDLVEHYVFFVAPSPT